MPTKSSANRPPTTTTGNAPAAPPNDTAAPARLFASEAEMDAARLTEVMLPACLTQMLPQLGLDGITLALENFLREAGSPKDPVERLLLQQMFLAHWRTILLHVRAAGAAQAEVAEIYHGAACRLQGEFRRSMLALRTYRAPIGQKTFAVVHQQNVVSGGDQHVQYLDRGQGKETLIARNELKDNAVERRLRGERVLPEEPQACGGRAAQRPVAQAVDA